ncbi:DoxX family membrane protein [Hymenobacter sp. RP-2-7]|uniref:DoxX family membrane protein n=1 Tax=Hymenobacter polaris TaxID=2682546 RepID=A0A7Y0AI89_9BACT|nr:DoxX family membrane protein [Hymenobacter polaris]NML67868.1 DoxX family membrane protein [Hymenobacter polaris]
MAAVASLRARRWDYFILTARVLLAGIFFVYGVGKLVGLQFGVTPEILAQPLGQVSLSHLAWYCFDHQPFTAYIGVSQILASLGLLWNRTALLGALLLLPIAVTIFVIDLTYLRQMVAFQYMLPFYIGLLLLILAHYRARMLVVVRALTQGVTTRFAYPWWGYCFLPLAAGLLSLGWMLPMYTVSFLQNSSGTLGYFQRLVTSAAAWLK